MCRDSTASNGDNKRGADQNCHDRERNAHTESNDFRLRCRDVVVADAIANTAPMTDTPVMSPRFRVRLNRPEMTPRWSGGHLS